MKRILIFSQCMELGGVERSLLGLLEALPRECNIDLFLCRHTGELMGYVPRHINLLPEIPAYAALGVPAGEALKRGQLAVLGGRAIAKCRARAYNRREGICGENCTELTYSHRYTAFAMPRINPAVEYDLAISFLTPHYFVAKRVRAKRRLAWIHTDYGAIGFDREAELAMWGAYPHIAAVSEACGENFVRAFPELGERVQVIENILPEALIRAQSRGPAEEMDPKSIRLLSVGRFCRAKNFDNVPDICRRLVDEHRCNVKWYLIGYGGDGARIEQAIRNAGMEERVILLGKRENPYPYMRNCDLYVQPSRYEGKAVTVREAQMLGKPVVITSFPTARSQLEDGVDGLIVPMDNAGCAEGIAALLRDESTRRQLSANCARRDYSNRSGINRVLELL